MRHIHTYIVPMHLVTRGNNKILRTPSPHISSSEEILPASLVAPLPNSEQINHPSWNYIYTKSTTNHIHHHYVPSVTHTHTHHLFNCTHIHTHRIVIPGFVDRSRRSDYTASLMDREAGWWTTSGNIGLPPLANVMGVGRKQQLACFRKYTVPYFPNTM